MKKEKPKYCPKCGSNSRMACGATTNINDKIHYQYFVCEDCTFKWVEHYHFNEWKEIKE